MDELLKNIERCPVLVIFIIIQIVIQGYDFYKRNFIAAFIHFWLGFIFYISYKSTLCTEKDINLGIEKLLIVLAFVFCQIVLLRISNTINRVSVRDNRPKKKKEKIEDLGQDNNLIDYWNRNVGNNLDSYSIMKIKPNKTQNKIDTIVGNIKKFSLSRGTELKLKNGKIVSITGFEYKNQGSSYVTLNLDNSVNINESFVYVKMTSVEDVMGEFDKNSNINDIIGRKERQLEERIEEIGKNISLLKDAIKKKEQEFKKERWWYRISIFKCK